MKEEENSRSLRLVRARPRSIVIGPVAMAIMAEAEDKMKLIGFEAVVETQSSGHYTPVDVCGHVHRIESNNGARWIVLPCKTHYHGVSRETKWN